MNLETQQLADPRRQLTNLKQVVLRSEAAIVALQKSVRVAESKIKTLEKQVEPRRSMEPTMTLSRVYDHSVNGLKMFE